ncbi:hypothetical protein BpHYR1_018740 [Brachionus plicatilis]|uniref:Uncharacterized protein n=1 Tax=Brachionus plicatilis TaxID=10195 RepID=A0A3M7QA02_BRAPC|nr:hypothetical protein BpHYR1_018740 [Brachionus plicatilis]
MINRLNVEVCSSKINQHTTRLITSNNEDNALSINDEYYCKVLARNEIIGHIKIDKFRPPKNE